MHIIVTNSNHRFSKMVGACNAGPIRRPGHRGPKHLVLEQTICHRFGANQASLKNGALAYNLLHMIREFHLHDEDVKRSMQRLIRRIINATYRIS